MPSLLPFGPMPVPATVPALTCEELSPAVEEVPVPVPVPAALPPVVAEPPCAALALLAGPTTNEPDNSAVGITEEAFGGTPTALMTTTDSGALGAVVENCGRARSVAVAIFGTAASAGTTDDCFGTPIGSTGTWM